MEIDQKTKFDYLYTIRGFKKIESDLEETTLKRMGERLSTTSIPNIQDYSLPPITMNEVKSRVKSMRKQLFPQVGLQVDSFVPELVLHNKEWDEVFNKVITKEKQLAFLYEQGKINDDQINKGM